MEDPPLSQFLDKQLHDLCEMVGLDPRSASALLADLLGPVGSRPVSQPPAWPSGVADDHTPVEFSVAFNENERPIVRILGESLAAAPSPATNMAAAYEFVARQAARFGLSTAQFDQVRDVFATESPVGGFALWHSLVFRQQRRPEFKVYFNPELTGVARAPGLVAEAMSRLGLSRAHEATLTRAIRPRELGRADRLTFFALDLHDGPHARVKLYVSHHDAEIRDVAHAAGVVNGIDTDELADFCLTAGGQKTFADRPLVGSYTFLSGSDGERPAGYSLYVPIRSYVSDDAEARDRVGTLMERYGFDVHELDRIIAALAGRPLDDGVGLIAHVSLRLGPPRPGITVYLSAEAYRVAPPRRRWHPSAQDHAQQPAGCCAA